MSNGNTYLALTIGPIYKTLKSVKSTKGIWGASFMFSYLMREIINAFVTNTKRQPDFLMPYIPYSNGSINWDEINMKKVGLLPDRFIAEAQEDDFKHLDDAIKTVLKKFAEQSQVSLSNHFNSYNSRISNRKEYYSKTESITITNEIENFLHNYLQAYFIEIDNSGSNPVLSVQQYLDNIELQQKVMPQESMPFLYDLFENCYYNFMVHNEFKKTDGKVNFPSTIEIASKQFQIDDENKFNNAVKDVLDKKSQLNNSKEEETNDSNSQEAFIQELKDSFSKTDFKQHHKYITVMQADGDNLGKFISLIYDMYSGDEAKKIFNAFSRNILTFSKCAVELITRYGGTNIYAGGDDLLFFAPAMISSDQTLTSEIFSINYEATKTKADDFNKIFKDEPNGKTIFWLVEKIDALFKLFISRNSIFDKVLEKCNSEWKMPGMSYGISISYYKYPLNEALDNGIRLLFQTAKKTARKNAVSFSVMKHSGQFFGTTFHKDDPSFKRFNEMLKASVNTNANDDNNFLTSVMHKLDDQQIVLAELTGGMLNNDDEKDTTNNLLQFFENNFDEAIHKGTKKGFLKQVRHLVREVFDEKRLAVSVSDIDKQKWLDNRMEKIYACLRFIQFIKADDKDE